MACFPHSGILFHPAPGVDGREIFLAVQNFVSKTRSHPELVYDDNSSGLFSNEFRRLNLFERGHTPGLIVYFDDHGDVTVSRSQSMTQEAVASRGALYDVAFNQVYPRTYSLLLYLKAQDDTWLRVFYFKNIPTS